MSRTDYHHDPSAPRASSLVPGASAIVVNRQAGAPWPDLPLRLPPHPGPGTPADIVASSEADSPSTPAPAAQGRWLLAGVLDEAGRSPSAVIKDACRHLVKERMDITGARWDSRAPKPC